MTVSPGALSKFAFVLAGSQNNGAPFTGTNTLTAEDAYGNAVTDFAASGDHVTITANSPLSGTVSGLGSGLNNILNQAGDFTNGVANLTALGMKYTGVAATGTFTATSATARADGHFGERDDQRRHRHPPRHHRVCGADRGHEPEPDDYGQGRLGQHRHGLHRPEDPDLQWRRLDRSLQPEGDQLGRLRSRLREPDLDHLHQRRGDRLRREQRRR